MRVRKSPRARDGFSAIELLAATMLAALLMSAILGVLRAMTHGQQALFFRDTPQPWQSRIVECLDWDLANSHSIRTTPDGIALEGFAGRDFVRGLPVHRPTVVLYTIRGEGRLACLVREERQLDSLSLDNSSGEILVIGAHQFEFTPLLEATAQDGQASEPIADGPLPKHLQVALVDTESGRTVLHHAFHLR